MLRKLEHPDLHFTYPTIKLPSMSSDHKPVSDDFARQWHELITSTPYFDMDEWMQCMGGENQQAIITAGESDALLRKLSLKSSQGGRKVSIVWLPERMNTECANKLLKLIEEPPSQTVFIMVCEEPDKLLDTIRSRVQRIDVKKLSDNDIQQALVEGNKDVLRKTVTLLDSFSVKAEGSFVIGPVLNLSCQTRQFMNFYLGTYDDNLQGNLDCISTSLDNRSNDGLIYVMLRDSLKAMHQSGELEKNLASLPSGDRAFWRIVIASLSADQDKTNTLVKANVDSIKKIEQRDFVLKNYYKEATLSNFTAQVGLGAGLSLPLGDSRDYFPTDWTPYIWLTFTYRGFDIGYSIHSMVSNDLTDSTFANAMYIDFSVGLRTFRTKYFEHRIMAGPSVIFTDIRLKDPPDSKDAVLEEETLCRYNVSTSLDFYFSGIKVDDPDDKRAMNKGHGRLGLRLLVGYSGYATDLLKNADGGNFYATLSLVFQGYGSRLKKYGE